VFILVPVATAKQVILCIGAFFVFMLCTPLAGGLDEENTGYWPDPPNKL